MQTYNTMTDQELQQELRRLNQSGARDAWLKIVAIVAEMTERQMAAEGERR